jgi:hypothetical protein
MVDFLSRTKGRVIINRLDFDSTLKDSIVDFGLLEQEGHGQASQSSTGNENKW